MPRHIASIWSTKTFGLADEAQLRLGAGIVYSGKSKSTGPLDPYGINPAIPASALYTVVTPSRRSEEHTSELQSLMRISYAVFCLKKKKTKITKQQTQPQKPHTAR